MMLVLGTEVRIFSGGMLGSPNHARIGFFFKLTEVKQIFGSIRINSYNFIFIIFNFVTRTY
jgi:hypothetical protein